MPNGAARLAACWLGALAGRNALLLPWVTLASDGKYFGTATAATIQAAMTSQRNLTANAPIPPKMAWMRTRSAYKEPRPQGETVSQAENRTASHLGYGSGPCR